MIDKRAVDNFTLDLPTPPVKQRVAPADWKPVDDNYPELKGFVGFDTETDDPGLANKIGSSWVRRGEGSICGFSVAYGPKEDRKSFYIGLNHAGGNSDYDKACRWILAQAAKPDVTLVGANVVYDLGWMGRMRDLPLQLGNHPVDVAGMAALLDADRFSYSLDSLLHSYLGRRKNTKALLDAAREYGITNPYLHMKRLPTWDVATYGADDAADALDLFEAMMPEIEKQGLRRVWELERECSLVAYDLRRVGVRVDADQLEQVHRRFAKRREDAIHEIRRITGVEISPNDTTAIARALEVETPSIQLERTSKGIPSIRVGILDALATPVAKLVRAARKYDKAIGTTILGLQKYLGPDGRVHAEFHPLRKSRDEEKGEGVGNVGVGPGRWSCSDPNLQNIPRRDPDVGIEIRECFKAEEGERWAKLDFSSQEPRGATHFAAMMKLTDPRWSRPRWQGGFGLHLTDDGRLRGAMEMVERYRANPTMSMHKEVAKAMGIDPAENEALYDKVKIVNLGIIYGMQGKRFAQDNGYPTKWITTRSGRQVEVAGDEAQALLDKHYEAVPFLKDAFEVAKQVADERGYVTTFLGRRMRFNLKSPEGRVYNTHKALNNVVQGTAADQMKMAQVLMRREGINPLVVVHDDANISLDRGEAGARRLRRAEEIMAHAIELLVPSLAESKVGEDWGDVSKPKGWRRPE